MKIKYKPQPLWNKTPCTIPFISSSPVINRQRRFSYFSIYHKDDVNKQKKVYSDIEKPQLIISSFRRKLKQAQFSMKFNRNVSSTQKTFKKKRSLFIESDQNPQSIKKITNKLYKVPLKTQYKHDLHGYRSSMVGNYNVKQIILSKKFQRNNFTSGRRTDFTRPHNFYPGPGAYYRENPGNLNATYLNLGCKNFKGNTKKLQILLYRKNKSSKDQVRLAKQI